MEFARHNHSVPEAYLRGWSNDGVYVLARRLLVPAEAYPHWEKKRVRSLGAYQHLYTSVRDGVSSDSIERWFNQEFESPAAEAIDKVRRNVRLSTQDFHRLAFYAASLNVRTPASYLEQVRRWERDMPQLMDDVLKRAKGELERAADTGIPLLPGPSIRQEDRPPLKVTIERDAPDGPHIKTEVVIGRELWLHGIRHVLQGIVHVLKQHRWHIVRPHPGYAWLTSDHPTLRLNYNSVSQYDFGGGWGNKGSEILLPLSPEHILYTQIGNPHSGLVRFSKEQTELIQRFLAERAHRWIIAHADHPRPSKDRPRKVDKAAFREEEDAWSQWHDSQSAAASDEDAA